LGTNILTEVSDKKYFGVIVHQSLKAAAQCNDDVKSAHLVRLVEHLCPEIK